MGRTKKQRTYSQEVANKMLARAGRLEEKQSDYMIYMPGQPSNSQLAELLALHYPDREFEIHENLNGTTIKRISHEC